MARRSQYVAHTGATDPPTRTVDDSVAGWVSVSEPSGLTVEQLLELSELCRKLRDKLEKKLGLT